MTWLSLCVTAFVFVGCTGEIQDVGVDSGATGGGSGGGSGGGGGTSPVVDAGRTDAGAQASTDAGQNANDDAGTAETDAGLEVIPDAGLYAFSAAATLAEDSTASITLTARDATSFSLVAQPSHGTLTGSAPNLTYSPAADFNGADSFTFKANDGTIDSNVALVSITVTPVNDAPVATASTVTLNEDIPTQVSLSATDVDGDALTYAIVTAPVHGTLTGTGAARTYTPAANYAGVDSFDFKANDGTADSNTVTVLLTISAVNDAPIAIAQTLTTLEDTALALTLTGTDAEANTLTFAVVTNPAHGTLTGTGSSLTYVPASNFSGVDSFTFKANDGTSDSAPATVTVNVTAVNDAPSALAQVLIINEDEARPVMLTGTDPDGDPLTFTIITSPAHGSLSGSAPNLTYTPVANYSGTDSFTFNVTDGSATSATAAILITITPVNDAPTAIAQSVTTLEDTPRAITLTGTDVEGSALTFSVMGSPGHGTLSGTAPNLIFTPAANYAGSDSFTFRVSDGSAFSATATVSITMTPVNDAPSAIGQSVALDEDATVLIVLTGTDPEASALTYAIGAAPAHGTFTGTAPNLTYAPAANYSGTDSFTFRVNDGSLDSALATVVITIRPINDAPTANAQTVVTAAATAKAITLTGTDADGDTLTFAVVTTVSHGSLTGSAPNLVYTSTAGYNGPDAFTFRVNDGTVNSGNATVSINVSFTNTPPSATAQSVTVVEDTPKVITLTGTDPEGATLTFTITSPPVNGVLSGSSPNFTFTPTLNFNGTDSFTFVANDGSFNSSAATVSLTVTPVNDVPVAGAQTLNGTEDTMLLITLTGIDVEGSPLTYAVATQPAHGVLSGTAPNLAYSPDSNYAGLDSFTFTVSDGVNNSPAATVSINLGAVNDPPTASSFNTTLAEDTPTALTLGASDPEGAALTFSVVTPPAHGTLSGTAPNLTFTPAANYFGTDSFTYRANDGVNNSNTATVSLTIVSVNDAPVANAQAVSLAEDGTLAITLTATDPDGPSLTYSLLTSPGHGALTGTAPNVTYTPVANYNGADSFEFRVSDGVLTASAIVSITVTAVNDLPVATAQTVTVNEDTIIDYVLSGTDADVGTTLTYQVTTTPAHGTLTGTPPAQRYRGLSNYNGPDSYTFRVNDGTAYSVNATVTIDVVSVNDAPVAFARFASGNEDAALAIFLTGSDADNDPLTYLEVTQPAHGTLGPGVDATRRVYTPDANFNGTDSFTYKVNDGTIDSNTATVSITISAVNDAPIANAQTVNATEDTPVAITLTGSDIEGSAITFSLAGSPVHGTLSGTIPNLTYTPAANYNGPDSFAFVTNDGSLNSAPATVTIAVAPVNDVPVANAQTVAVVEDTATSLTLTGSDADGDALTYSIVTAPAHGTLSAGTAAARTYTPAANYNGADSFTFRVNDGTANSLVVTVTINISAVNDAPVGTAASYTYAEDSGAQTLTLGCTDADGDPLTYSISSAPSKGTLSAGTGATRTYTPLLNQNGADSFGFRCNDGTVNSTSVSISMTLTPVNDAPSATQQSLFFIKNSSNNAITLTGTDPEGDTLSFAIVTGPAHGTLGGSGSNRTYTPTASYTGSDNFTFTVSDGTLTSVSATIFLTISASSPVWSNLPVTVSCTPGVAPAALTVLATDADGDALTYSLNTAASTCPTGAGGISVSAAGVVGGICPNVGSACQYNIRVSDGTNTVASNYYVNPNTRYLKPVATGTGTGVSWVNAASNIGSASTSLGAVAAHLWLANGTYTGQGTAGAEIAALQAGHQLYGGFVGNELTFAARPSVINAATTVISGDLDASGTHNAADAAMGLKLANNNVVDGLEIRDLFGVAANGGALNCAGAFTASATNVRLTNNGGSRSALVVSSGCTFTLNDAWVAENSPTGAGAGFTVSTASSLNVNRSYFIGNGSSGPSGGAGFVDSSSTLNFFDSMAHFNGTLYDGSAIAIYASTANIRRSLFTKTYSTTLTQTAPITISSASTVRIQDVRIIEPYVVNVAATAGVTGIHTIAGATGPLTMNNVLVEGIRSRATGGGLWQEGTMAVTIASSTFADNLFATQQPANYGAAVLNDNAAAAPVTVINSAFYNNKEGLTGSAVSRDLKARAGTLVTSSYSCGETLGAGTGNLTLSTLPFVFTAGKDTYLNQTSTCVSAGDSTSATAAFTSYGPSWSTFTTNSATFALDTGVVDMGFHYDVATPRIDAFTVLAGNYSWVVGTNYSGCFVYNQSTGSVTATAAASGTVAHALASGVVLSLVCTSSKGPGTGATATAKVP